MPIVAKRGIRTIVAKRLVINGVPTAGAGALRPEAPLTPAEVGALFRVEAGTVTRWAREGKLASFRTPGGHRRFSRAEVIALLNSSTSGRAS